jgi:hypothetical protein
MSINVEMFERVKYDLENGEVLTLGMVMSVFGQDFCELLVNCLMDSQDAARAIQGAIARLKSGEENDAYTSEEVDEAEIN